MVHIASIIQYESHIMRSMRKDNVEYTMGFTQYLMLNIESGQYIIPYLPAHNIYST